MAGQLELQIFNVFLEQLLFLNKHFPLFLKYVLEFLIEGVVLFPGLLPAPLHLESFVLIS